MTPKKRAAKAWLSPKAFGAQRSPPVTRQAVMRALVSGRLSKKSASRTDAGHWRIDPETGNAEWDDWTDPTKSRAGNDAGGRPPKTPSLFEEQRAEEAVSHARASAARIRVDTELRVLELEERRGNIIPREAATRTFFTLAREVRDRVMAVPDRVASQVHALPSIQAVHALLTRELAHALEQLARSGLNEGKVE